MQHSPELLYAELVLARRNFRRALAIFEGIGGKRAPTEQEDLVGTAHRYTRAVRRFRKEVTRGVA